MTGAGPVSFSKDEAGRIAANVAKPAVLSVGPGLLRYRLLADVDAETAVVVMMMVVMMIVEPWENAVIPPMMMVMMVMMVVVMIIILRHPFLALRLSCGDAGVIRLQRV
jgi:hypothetical protein